ncbi:hypothetical protein CFC21_069428 [Triticum aestivum]|uniref:Phenylalanine ammonia-lyase n=2 Tax=Triticum aestivum TaxID=4565 RepID=A0A9R1KQQ7_WHEAT|nr:hypothetical protein CFC21_069428 [Triticum aestivum]
MVARFREPIVRILGAGLSVGQVAAVAHAKDAASVTVDEARVRVRACSDWIIHSVASGGDIYGVTTGFGGTSHRPTKDGHGLQVELVRVIYSLLSAFSFVDVTEACGDAVDVTAVCHRVDDPVDAGLDADARLVDGDAGGVLGVCNGSHLTDAEAGPQDPDDRLTESRHHALDLVEVAAVLASSLSHPRAATPKDGSGGAAVPRLLPPPLAPPPAAAGQIRQGKALAVAGGGGFFLLPSDLGDMGWPVRRRRQAHVGPGGAVAVAPVGVVPRLGGVLAATARNAVAACPWPRPGSDLGVGGLRAAREDLRRSSPAPVGSLGADGGGGAEASGGCVPGLVSCLDSSGRRGVGQWPVLVAVAGVGGRGVVWSNSNCPAVRRLHGGSQALHAAKAGFSSASTRLRSDCVDLCVISSSSGLYFC